MKDEANYACDAGAEEIVLPIDVSAGSAQVYGEDSPVRCGPHVVQVEIDGVGERASVAAGRHHTCNCFLFAAVGGR